MGLLRQGTELCASRERVTTVRDTARHLGGMGAPSLNQILGDGPLQQEKQPPLHRVAWSRARVAEAQLAGLGLEQLRLFQAREG